MVAVLLAQSSKKPSEISVEESDEGKKELAFKETSIQENYKTIFEEFVDMYTPPYTFVMTNYQLIKGKASYYESPPMYTHLGGYKFQLLVHPDRQQHPYVIVTIWLLKGVYNDMLKFPVRFTISLELLNQHKDQDHYIRNITCKATLDKLHFTVNI